MLRRAMEILYFYLPICDIAMHYDRQRDVFMMRAAAIMIISSRRTRQRWVAAALFGTERLTRVAEKVTIDDTAALTRYGYGLFRRLSENFCALCRARRRRSSYTLVVILIYLMSALVRAPLAPPRCRDTGGLVDDTTTYYRY